MSWSKRIPFKVSVAGIIEIMGKSLYSRPDTAVRELIQNAHDAVMRRRQQDLNYKGQIRIQLRPDDGQLVFHDDGIGLSAEECEAYLGTLGVGMTGQIRRGVASSLPADLPYLIGQFGIGLFSAFLLADRLVVESRRVDATQGVRWEAGPDSEVELSSHEREEAGSSVTLMLKPEFRAFAEDKELVEQIVRRYADYLPIPIYLDGQSQRANVIHVPWLDATQEREAVELALESQFNETPLDIALLRSEQPVSIAGALYVTPRRLPGFSGESVVTATVRRMVISRQIQGLLPPWAPFIRGMLELNDCSPTASREDLVRDEMFHAAAAHLEQCLYEHFERIGEQEPSRWEAVLSWHRYTWTGAALDDARIRDLLRRTYRFPTSHGPLTFDELIDKSAADPLFESEAERVVWYNGDRRQERWINSLFADQEVPCVHALRTFEEALLAMMIEDRVLESDEHVELRVATPGAAGFASQILGVHDLEEAPEEWQDFLASTGAQIFCASFAPHLPVMAFLNERHELKKTFDELKAEGNIPSGFQRIIDQQFAGDPVERNEVLLNRDHKLVGRALSQKTNMPLASVLRLLVMQALNASGASLTRGAQRLQTDDLDWIAEALWSRE